MGNCNVVNFVIVINYNFHVIVIITEFLTVNVIVIEIWNCEVIGPITCQLIP